MDCAADGATVVSGGADGRVVLWSHVTGFKLAVFTLHSAAIRCLSFSPGAMCVWWGEVLLLLWGSVAVRERHGSTRACEAVSNVPSGLTP